jgi:hypothetical protein
MGKPSCLKKNLPGMQASGPDFVYHAGGLSATLAVDAALMATNDNALSRPTVLEQSTVP